MKGIKHIICKRALACILCVSMVAICIPGAFISAIADPQPSAENTKTEEEANTKTTDNENAEENIDNSTAATDQAADATSSAEVIDTSAYTPNKSLQEPSYTYNAAVLEADRLTFEIKQCQEQIAQIETELPALRSLSEACMCSQYKQLSTSKTVMSCLLNSKSVTDSLAMLDAYDWFYEYNVDSMNKYIEKKNEKKKLEEQVEKDQIALEEANKIANENMQNAVQARQDIQTSAAERQAAENLTTNPISNPAAAATSENVDWNVASKQEFVDKWAARIDKYLEGSPTAGCGVYYAQYAWDFGVDPRWAPAISNTESSKGAHCFRSYNAWGFGQLDFQSWQQGIEHVVSTLSSSLYGNYLTKNAASVYCPPTWSEWYKNTAEQMALI